MTGARMPRRPEEIRPGLERIRAAFGMTGHQERSFRTLHIAGTNGKGSTAAFSEAILRNLASDPVGLYTSPHLLDVSERIRVDGARIPEKALRGGLRRSRELSERLEEGGKDPLSWFEELTWVACDWFRRKNVRIAVMEAGLGGRWDATNVCVPFVSVITTVGIDHREWLGGTVREIASEKAGILKRGIRAVLGRMSSPALRVVLGRAAELGSPVWRLGEDFRWEEEAGGRIRIRLPGLVVPPSRIGLAGRFQRDNASVACAAAWQAASLRGTPAGVFARAASEGIAKARWPGRLMPLPGRGNAGAWTDGAHNVQAARALARELRDIRTRGKADRVIALWSMLRDKDISGFLGEMSESVEGWVVFPLEDERAAPLGMLSEACRRGKLSYLTARDFPDGWRTARKWAGESGIVIVCGSLVAVGEAFRYRALEVA
jgi:dihydrofolate synthase/folylpolyglutamate synthase